MSGYNYTHFVKEFAERTRMNLEIVEKSDAPSAKEVTQLINSLLGLLVVPNERYKFSRNNNNRCTEYALRAANKTSYGKIKDIINNIKAEKKFFCDYDNEKNYPVSNFIKHLRNAVCHSGNNTLRVLPPQP